MEQPVQTMKTFVLLKRFFPYFRKYRKALALDLFCASLTTLCDLALPMIVRNITGLAADNMALLTMEYVLRVGALYFILRVIDGAANYYMAANGHIMGVTIEKDMRRDLFSHL